MFLSLKDAIGVNNDPPLIGPFGVDELMMIIRICFVNLNVIVWVIEHKVFAVSPHTLVARDPGSNHVHLSWYLSGAVMTNYRKKINVDMFKHSTVCVCVFVCLCTCDTHIYASDNHTT